MPESKRKYIEKFYNWRCSKNINSPDVVGWVNRKSQHERFNTFLKYIKTGDSVLDYGCGVGDFFKYSSKFKLTSKTISLGLDIKYKGVDIQPNMIEKAKKKYPEGDFSVVNSIEDVKDTFDWIIASGVFTIGMNEYDVLNYFSKGIKKATKGIGANFLITNRSQEITSGEQFIHYNPELLKEFLEEYLMNEEGLDVELTLIDNYTYDDFTLILKK